MSKIKIFGISVLVILSLIILSFVGLGIRMCNNGQKVIYDQFKPEELLRKYEWFKDCSSSLDAKIATLGTYETRFQSLKKGYGADSLNRSKWSRDDREQYNIWESEYLGIKSSYNQLAADYNSQMSKFNWRFCNRGDLPQGADIPLPREYKPYINN